MSTLGKLPRGSIHYATSSAFLQIVPFKVKPTGDRDLQLLLATRRKNISKEVLLGNANVLHCAVLLTLGWANLLKA